MERVPVLKIRDVLLVSIQVDLEDSTALALQDDLSAKIVATGAHGVIIDISGLEIVDSFIGRMLSTIAQTIVALGIEFGDIATKASLADALRLALRDQGLELARRPR